MMANHPAINQTAQMDFHDKQPIHIHVNCNSGWFIVIYKFIIYNFKKQHGLIFVSQIPRHILKRLDDDKWGYETWHGLYRRCEAQNIVSFSRWYGSVIKPPHDFVFTRSLTHVNTVGKARRQQWHRHQSGPKSIESDRNDSLEGLVLKSVTQHLDGLTRGAFIKQWLRSPRSLVVACRVEGRHQRSFICLQGTNHEDCQMLQ